VEFLIITFVPNFIIRVSESVCAAEVDVTDMLVVVYNLWLKISYKVLSNGYVLGLQVEICEVRYTDEPFKQRTGLCQ